MINVNAAVNTHTALQPTKPHASSELGRGVPPSSQTEVNTGFAITEGMEIDLSQYELKVFPGVIPDLPAPMSLEDYESQLLRQGEAKQSAVIESGGIIVGTISDQGATFFNNAMGNAVARAGHEIDAIQSALSERYGDSVRVVQFAEGAGPTYAEIHEAVYGESYSSLVERQTREFQLNQNNVGRLVDVKV